MTTDPAPESRQERHRELGQLQGALDVDLRDGRPIVEVAIEETSHRCVQRRDVHEAVEPAEGGTGDRHQFLARREGTDVRFDRERRGLVDAEVAENRSHSNSVEITEHDARSRPQCLTRHRSAQPGPDAGHHDHLAIERTDALLAHRATPS